MAPKCHIYPILGIIRIFLNKLEKQSNKNNNPDGVTEGRTDRRKELNSKLEDKKTHSQEAFISRLSCKQEVKIYTQCLRFLV